MAYMMPTPTSWPSGHQRRRCSGGGQAVSPRRQAPEGTGLERPGAQSTDHRCLPSRHLRDFFFLCTILDGCGRFVIRWEIRETMKEAEVEMIVQRAREQCAGERPRIVSDDGRQLVAETQGVYTHMWHD